jgi:hypothetical protein
VTLPTIPYTLLQAVARMEGWYDVGPPNRPQRNFNPCDLEWRPWMTRFYSTHGDPRFAVFPNADEGFAAARHLFGFPIYKGTTIEEFVPIFAPATENNVRVYIANLEAWTERPGNTVIDGILG